MFVVILGAIAAATGVPIPIVIGALVVTFLPFEVSMMMIAVVSGIAAVQRVRRRRSAAVNEAEFLRQLSGRVASGATIRSAITDETWKQVPDGARRMAALGRPMEEVSDALSSVLARNAVAFKGVCSFSEQTGASVAAALGVLADQADDASELERERRVALAQAKFSAVVVGVVPIAVSLILVVMRGIPDPGGAPVVVPMIAGVGLQTVGTAIVFRVAAGSA